MDWYGCASVVVYVVAALILRVLTDVLVYVNMVFFMYVTHVNTCKQRTPPIMTATPDIVLDNYANRRGASTRVIVTVARCVQLARRRIIALVLETQGAS